MPLNLTEGRRFCLEELAKDCLTGREISKRAARAGINRTSNGSAEWADKYLLWLRSFDLAEITGDNRDSGRIHRITQKGIEALSAEPGDPVASDERKIWKPMADAPKDGRWIIGDFGDSGPKQMRWGKLENLCAHWLAFGRWTPEDPTAWTEMPARPHSKG